MNRTVVPTFCIKSLLSHVLSRALQSGVDIIKHVQGHVTEHYAMHHIAKTVEDNLLCPGSICLKLFQSTLKEMYLESYDT